ncbi:MAG: response regulator [Planctomycetes bacterium]|nr:response regulator [Planctomycetota bacterium]
MTAKKRILIVDDEEPIRFALTTILQDQGYEVDASETGNAGLKKLGENRYNIVLLDYNLPDINGLEVAQKAREIDNDVPIVFVSAYGTTDVILRAVRVGAFDFIEKPIHSEELFSSIERWAVTRKEQTEKTLEKIKKALSADLDQGVK